MRYTKSFSEEKQEEMRATEVGDSTTLVSVYLGASDADERCETVTEGALHSHVQYNTCNLEYKRGLGTMRVHLRVRA